jgi:hypothetical protein
MFYSPVGYTTKEDCIPVIQSALVAGQAIANYDTGGSTVNLYENPGFVAPALGRVGAAFITEQGSIAAALDALAAYFLQLLSVDEMAEENAEGLSIWHVAQCQQAMDQPLCPFQDYRWRQSIWI